MVYVVGKGEPPIEDGWRILGNNYTEVWSDPKKLEMYNAVYPPDEQNKPRPFGAFSGLGGEMGLTSSVPTTRQRGILRIPVGQSGEHGHFVGFLP